MLGDQIRLAREERGWTQRQLATALDVGLKTINNWESNRVIPKNRLGMIRSVLGIDVQDAPEVNPLANLSDLMLLNELTRRTIEREHGSRPVD